MKNLEQKKIEQKVMGLVFEIMENNYQEEEVILAGINRNGLTFAQMLFEQLTKKGKGRFMLTSIRLNPAAPLDSGTQIDMPVENLRGKVIIIVDDVANTGRTLFYACKPLLDTLPKKIEMAVLVDRTHKSFPVKVDYVGLSLATTLKDNSAVKIREVEEKSVFLD